MLSIFDRVIRAVVRGAGALSVMMLLAGVMLNLINIVGRYFFHAPIGWAEDVMLDLMLGMVFLGAGRVTLRSRHIRMDIVLRIFPPTLRPWFEFLAELAFLVTAVTAIALTVPVVLQFAQFDQRSEAANIPIWIPQSIVPIGIGIMLLASLTRLLERFIYRAGLNREQKSSEESRP